MVCHLVVLSGFGPVTGCYNPLCIDVYNNYIRDVKEGNHTLVYECG